MSYAVEVLDEVKDIDMPELLDIDRALGRVVAELVRDLHDDPSLGREMRERMRLVVLKDCRKISFDVPSHDGKPRFRLVYRNQPNDGSIAVITVLASARAKACRRTSKRRRASAHNSDKGVSRFSNPVRGPT